MCVLQALLICNMYLNRRTFRFVWISRSTSKRSMDNVMGDLSSPWVRLGNLLSARFALLCLVAVVAGCFWCVPWH